MTEYLYNKSQEFGLPLTKEQLSRFDSFAAMMTEYNKHTNITRITDPCEIAVKHILDSLAVFKYADIPAGSSLLDVGSGAGFPSVPIAIYRPDISVSLLESNGKKTLFLQSALQNLSLSAEVICARAEEAAHDSRFRESFDFVTARAVANLNILAEYCLPFVKTGGRFIAYKGGGITEELSQCQNALSKLAGEIEDLYNYQLPDQHKRSLVIIKKIGITPPIYPRKNAKILQKPL
ncbi:MAG: 16S rRNA (guanine(527)-N(7))-methyltransferase RsmG [Oscillospiraceae bacterium]|nr:16S rRNA (guanine(527)-N(7))-methyltransferase RsmG [Oscillospiraceae bacterium]